jgi:hypothetical protein
MALQGCCRFYISKRQRCFGFYEVQLEDREVKREETRTCKRDYSNVSCSTTSAKPEIEFSLADSYPLVIRFGLPWPWAGLRERIFM